MLWKVSAREPMLLKEKKQHWIFYFKMIIDLHAGVKTNTEIPWAFYPVSPCKTLVQCNNPDDIETVTIRINSSLQGTLKLLFHGQTHFHPASITTFPTGHHSSILHFYTFVVSTMLHTWNHIVTFEIGIFPSTEHNSLGTHPGCCKRQ